MKVVRIDPGKREPATGALFIGTVARQAVIGEADSGQLRIEETSREGAHEWKAEVLKGRLQEVEWALSLLGHPGAPQTAEARHS